MRNVGITARQKQIRVGTHGGGTVLAAALAVLSFKVFHLAVLGALCTAAVAVLLAMLGWITWIRRQYAFGKGGMMERVHQTILSSLDFDGRGRLLEVGCGSGALTIRAALTWPSAQAVGLDYWGAMYNYSKAVCEKNARSEGVGDRCSFVHGDANRLDFPNECFDAVVSNYVYHNIMGADKQALLLESLRVLKKGGVFVLHDNMKPQMYGDMNAFVKKLREEMGFEQAEYTTYPYLTDVYAGRVYTARYEENRLFETMASQEAYFRFAGLRNGQFYVRKCADAATERRALAEIRGMLTKQEEK